MFKRFLLLTVFIISSAAFSALFAQNNKPADVKMFPDAKEGYKMVYIKLPSKKNEENLKVEVFVGKNMEVDKCNRHLLNGILNKENLEGWGYSYLTVTSNGEVSSTLMACPDAKKENKFITMIPRTLDYNSKLPLVIYVPEGLEVKYRIWKADKKLKSTTVVK